MWWPKKTILRCRTYPWWTSPYILTAQLEKQGYSIRWPPYYKDVQLVMLDGTFCTDFCRECSRLIYRPTRISNTPKTLTTLCFAHKISSPPIPKKWHYPANCLFRQQCGKNYIFKRYIWYLLSKWWNTYCMVVKEIDYDSTGYMQVWIWSANKTRNNLTMAMTTEGLFRQMKNLILTEIDNTPALITVNSNKITARIRHFLMREETIWEAIKDNIITLQYTPTNLCKADRLIKALQRTKYDTFGKQINLDLEHSA